MKVRLLEIAEIELDEAVRWYEAQAQGLGDAFLVEFLAAADRVSPRPGNWWKQAYVAAVSTASLMD